MTATTIFTIPAGETFQSFAQLNNILIVITDQNRYILKYDLDTEAYVQLEEIPMPRFYIGVNEWYNSSGTDSTFSGALTDLLSAGQAYKNSGYIEGRSYTFVRTAYKLYDGSYIKHSIPICIRSWETNSLDNESFPALLVVGSGISSWEVNYYAAEYLCTLTTEQKNILENYSGLITSICVFITNPKSEVIDYSTNPDEWSGQGIPPTLSAELTPESIFESEINYYKIAEIGIEDLLGDGMSAPERVIVPTTLISNDPLTIDNFSHHDIRGEKNYNYNSKLHLGNITTNLSEAFFPFEYTPLDTEVTDADYFYKVKVYLKTNEGERYVISETYTGLRKIFRSANDPLLVGPDVYYLMMNTIVGYPDPRAYKISITLSKESVDIDDFYLLEGFLLPLITEYNLKPHPFLNLAYAVTGHRLTAGGALWNSRYDLFSRRTFDSWTAVDIDNLINMSVSKVITDINRVQVSRLDNALVYPAENSYQIGNDDESVIGFGSVVEPLSDGQFGQFPLYVFTTAGIFVMEQGSGEILYSNILPLNKEVCTNPLSITDIGGGVVYATEKGLNILSGKQITEISELIKGYPKQYLVDDTTYKAYLDDPFFVELLSEVSTVDFLTYLEDAIIGYDYKNKEIIVSNNTYTYSYVFGIESGTWHKVNYVFSQFVILVPDTLGYREGILYSIKDEEIEYSETLLQTRPIKLGSLGRKSIDRLVLRGYFDVKELTYSGLYLFGSLDGKNYVFLRGKTPQNDSTFSDILLKKTHANFEFLIVVFAGQLQDSQINFIETTYFDRWANKLR